MEWYRNQVGPIEVIGTYQNNCVKILGYYEDKEFIFFEKVLNLWTYQEILAEDLYTKYGGKVAKAEKSIPTKSENLKLWLEAKYGQES